MEDKLAKRFKGKRYNYYSGYLLKKYGQRIQKVTVDAGFTCPNRDGSISTGGCIYCNNVSFNPGYNDPSKSITQQMEEGIEFLKRRYGVKKFFVYFQPYTNTYAPLEKLKEYYEQALSFPEVIGLTIGTRPDCVDDEKIEYLSQLAKEYDITVEYGLESIFDDTLKKINRGHDFDSFIKALDITVGKGIKICTHIILGFPWENKQEWLKEAEILSGLPIDYLKIHQLHIVKDTQIAHLHEKEPFTLLSYPQYLDVVISFIEKLNPNIVLQRLCGETQPLVLIAPKWGKRYPEILQDIDREMINRDTWQGKFYSKV